MRDCFRVVPFCCDFFCCVVYFGNKSYGGRNMQCILSALVAIIIALAPVFKIPLTVVPPKGELPRD